MVVQVPHEQVSHLLTGHRDVRGGDLRENGYSCGFSYQPFLFFLVLKLLKQFNLKIATAETTPNMLFNDTYFVKTWVS